MNTTATMTDSDRTAAMVKAITETIIPDLIVRASESASYSVREFAMVTGYLGKIKVRQTGARAFEVTGPVWRTAHYDRLCTNVIDHVSSIFDGTPNAIPLEAGLITTITRGRERFTW